MPNIDSDRERQKHQQKAPSSQAKLRPNYHQALTTPLSIPIVPPDSISTTKEAPTEVTDPVRTLLSAMKRAANQYVRAPIAARFAEISRKR